MKDTPQKDPQTEEKARLVTPAELLDGNLPLGEGGLRMLVWAETDEE